MNEDTTPIPETTEQDESATGLASRWKLEIQAAIDFVRDFWREGDEAIEEYLGKSGEDRLNLFHSDVDTKSSVLSGTPRVRAKRRFADARDDPARVSATMLERLLNTDIERDSDGYRRSLANAKSDWLKTGLGQVRLRYAVETEAVEGGEQITRQDVETDHVRWRDFLWSPSTTWETVRWIAYRLDVSRKDWEAQFPGQPFHVQGKDAKTEAKGDAAEPKNPQATAQVWEIWCKESRRVYHLSEQHDEILKVSGDEYGLPGFFPSPMPLMANLATSKCVPRSPYHLSKAQYDEAHELQRRIRNLVRMARVAGCYNSANDGLEKILDDAWDGKLVPVNNWSTFVDGGAMQGAIAFLPLKDIIDTIIALSNRLLMVKQQLGEMTGNSDMTRGQSDPNKTATAARGEMRMFSSRVQSEQDELARFASEAQRIRAFIISKQYDEKTLIERSNIERSEMMPAPVQPSLPGMPARPGPTTGVPNTALIQEAVKLLKDDFSAYRVDVDAESLSMTDFDAVQQEGTAIMTASAEYFQRWAPLIQGGGPQVGQFALEMFQAFISQFRGAERYEAIVDRFVTDMKAAAAQPKPPPPPDPMAVAKQAEAKAKVTVAQAKIQETALDGQVKQMEIAGEVQKLQAEVAADTAKTRNDLARAAAAPQVPPGVA